MYSDLIGRDVVICTKSRRWLVMHGTLAAVEGDTVRLKTARCAVYWSAATRSHQGLATTGPAPGSRITTAIDMAIVDGVEAILLATAQASARWVEAEGEWE